MSLWNFLKFCWSNELIDRIAHNVKNFAIFRGLFVVVFHNFLKAVGEFKEEVRAGDFWFGEF